jgi:hypothetical protein
MIFKSIKILPKAVNNAVTVRKIGITAGNVTGEKNELNTSGVAVGDTVGTGVAVGGTVGVGVSI